jgi:hypothetical protein
MKGIVTNNRKIQSEAITAMLSDYSFEGKLPENRGDTCIPTIRRSIKDNYVKFSLYDLGAGLSVIPFCLYKKLDLDKLVPTEVSHQMADKSTTIPIRVCENVPVMIARLKFTYNYWNAIFKHYKGCY